MVDFTSATGLAIRLEDVGKQYVIGGGIERHNTLRDRLAGSASRISRRIRSLGRSDRERANQANRFWALYDISFELARGEVLGIVGDNGAGKSTLLKLLSRITEPTTGEIAIRGRVGSLLEVGTGFHTELTGRENIYLNGAILGMTRADIERKFDEIVSFAEVERFIDTPVKHYSSGMYLRLGFAVAAYLEPEILLVDEVLAVGDAQFQRKCLGKMGDVASEGRTVILVSHNMTAIKNLCSRAVCLREGRLVEDGPPDAVVSNYLSHAVRERREDSWPDPATAPGNDKIRLCAARISPVAPAPVDTLTTRTPLALEFDYWDLDEDARLSLSVHLVNEQGVMVFNTGSIQEPGWHDRPVSKGLFRSSCFIPGDLLNDGLYRAEIMFVRDEGELAYRHPDVLVFQIHDERDPRLSWHGKWPGAVRPLLRWQTTELTPPKSGA